MENFWLVLCEAALSFSRRKKRQKREIPSPYPLFPCSPNHLTAFYVQGVHDIIFFYLGDCHNPLGMENGDIPDSSIFATVTGYEEDLTLFGAHRARLNSSSGYRTDPKALSHARNQSRSPFLSVSLPKEMVVTGIATQGLGQEWITKYRMFAADDAGNYKSIEVRRPYDSDPSPTLRSEELLATSRRENYYLTIL